MSQERPLTDLEAFHQDVEVLRKTLVEVERGMIYGLLKPGALDELYRSFLHVAFRGEIELIDSPAKSLQQVAGEAARAHLVRISRCFETGPAGRN
jgi:hypothetical protein